MLIRGGIVVTAVRQGKKLPIEALCVSAVGIDALETATPQSRRAEVYEAMNIRWTHCGCYITVIIRLRTDPVARQ